MEWSQAESVLLALLVSPVIGLLGAMLLLWAMKRLLPDRQLYEEPEEQRPPPLHIRALLVFTCTAVSFAHGSNDGQKGMGLIMLILIGVAPTAYALNRTMPDSSTPAFTQSATSAQRVFRARAAGTQVAPERTHAVLQDALRTKTTDRPKVYAALNTVSTEVATDLRTYGSLRKLPAAQTKNVRDDMYLVYDTLRLLGEDKDASVQRFPGGGAKALSDYEHLLEKGTRYIPTWVKVAVALSLGLRTMIGWRPIVVTVGEKIGKAHLTYGMGAAAELVAASTILLAQVKGMPVSTTQILSSGVAGTMVAVGAGLQRSTVRNIALAWIMTLPAATLLSGVLYAMLLAVVPALGLR
ncbi:inorganic phosphate transporter [Sphingomonas yunnanensis]|uniref:inorganic phosphate transporter n=1 Tax=Sphingomonas yunnanensis TaxID=310400 RepID=UPI0031BB7E92